MYREHPVKVSSTWFVGGGLGGFSPVILATARTELHLLSTCPCANRRRSFEVNIESSHAVSWVQFVVLVVVVVVADL